MFSFFSGLRISTRIALALALPILGLLGFSGHKVLIQFQVSAQMDQLRDMAELAPDASALVHELQKERGNSAGYIGTGGDEEFRQRLEQQRRQTDVAFDRFGTAIAGFDAAAYGETFGVRIAEAQAMLAELEARRRAVGDLTLTVGEMAQYYSATIARLLDIVAEMAIVSDDASLTNAISAYTSFLQAKERAGIERAMGASGFGAGRFEPAVHRRFVSLIAEQRAYLSIFATYARPDQRAFLAETVSGPAVDEVARMREIAIANPYGGEIGEITGTAWFDTITRKIDLLKVVEDRLSADLVAAAAAAGEAAHHAFVVLAAITVVLLATTACLAAIIVRGVTGPLGRMTRAMTALAEGDHSVGIVGVGRRDEIGGMATAVQVFKDNAIEAERLKAEQVAAAQRAEQEKRAAMHKLADDFEVGIGGVVDGVSSAASEMESTAQSMSAAAGHASDQATRVATAAEQASSNVQTVAAATEELDSSIAEISRQVQNQTAMAGEAADAAATTDQQVKNLAEQAQAIGEVVELITSIAEQTNLLALNATIEAARAGDAGKGFAVVASEVKNLANQTAKATEQIAGQIRAIQDQTGSTVAAIDLINRKIESMSGISAAVASAVEEQNAATGEIGRNVQEASTGTQEVSGSIVGVSQAAEEAGSGAAQVLASAGRLSEEAGQLSTQVSRFIAGIRAG